MENVIRYRHNIIKVDSIESFMNMKGGFNQNCRDVFFVRALGRNDSLAEDVGKMDRNLSDCMQQGRLFYNRLQKLPVLNGQTEDYAGYYDAWIQNGQRLLQTRLSQDNLNLQPVLGAAGKKILSIYETGRPGISASIRKNFIVKLLYWFDTVMEGFLQGWDERRCMKIVAADVEKEQEYLFYYFLTLAGCDVLLLQTRADLNIREELLRLSETFVIGSYGTCQLPDFEPGGSLPHPSEEGRQEAVRIRLPKRNRQAERTQRAGQDTQAVKIKLPERSRRAARTERDNQAVHIQLPEHSRSSMWDGRDRHSIHDTAEKRFEDLALLASSVVMIAIHNRQGEVIGTGSGIMVGSNGYILTNNHVAAGGSLYSIRIEDDERVYQTDEVIKYHSVFDLALLRIDRKLKPIPIYQGAQKLVRGQKVVAIGSPLGLFNSVSDGIISGFRSIDGVDMIQFTAPISSGSSGGAVLNMSGEVIGISTAGFDRGQNINLAVDYACINMFVKGFVTRSEWH